MCWAIRGTSLFYFLLHFKIIPKWEEKTLSQASCWYFLGIDSFNSISVFKKKKCINSRWFTDNNILRSVLNVWNNNSWPSSYIIAKCNQWTMFDNGKWVKLESPFTSSFSLWKYLFKIFFSAFHWGPKWSRLTSCLKIIGIFMSKSKIHFKW